MIEDKYFETLVNHLNAGSPFIEINNNYKDLNLYSTISYGDSEYQLNRLKNNIEKLKTVESDFIKSLESIKQYVKEKPKDDDFSQIESHINEFVKCKNLFAPFLRFLDNERVNFFKATDDFNILLKINPDLKLGKDLDIFENSYRELQKEFPHDKNNMLFSGLSNFIARVNELTFNINSIKENIHQVSEENLSIYYNNFDKEISKIQSMFNDENHYINEFFEDDFKDTKRFSKFLELKDNVDKEYQSIYNKVKDHMKLSSYADFVIEDSGNDLGDLIKKKVIYDDSKITIKLTGAKYSEMKIFDDNSILLTHRNEKKEAFSDTLGYFKAISEVVKSEFNGELKKYPMIAKKFSESLDTNIHNTNPAKLAINTFLESQSLLKASGFNIVDYFNNYDLKTDPFKNKFFENLDDNMNAIIKSHKVKQFAESIVSNKYRHLYNEESYSIFAEILDAEITKPQLQNLIGKKIAFYKTPEQFNEGLRDVFEKLDGFHIEGYLAKAEEYKAKIISSEDNVLILQIENFEQSEKLGSTSWCISRQKHYFNSYTSDNNKQFFVYNFNLDSTDEDSMIGMTLHKDNSLYVAHSKFDEQISTQTPELHKYERTIVNQLNSEEKAELHNKTKNNNQLN